MSATTPALVAAAAGVGFGHAVLPDHWVPLAVVGRTRRYSLSRVARLSGLAGIGHVMVSVLLGAAIVAIGLQFRSKVESAQNTIVGSVLVATGIGLLVFECSGYGHSGPHSHSHEHGHSPAHSHPGDRAGGLPGLLATMIPFGAAASPDLTILPVFLAAAAVGAGTAIGSLVAFALVTVVTIVGLTVLATLGGYQVRGKWLDRWGNTVAAVVLLIIGTLVVAGTI